MSSIYVRSVFKNFLPTIAPEETIIDLTGEYEELKDILVRHGVGVTDSWLGLQFVGSMEEPMGIDSQNDRGRYREFGAIQLHVVERSRIGVGDAILSRAEALRNGLRGIRIDDMVILKVSPPNLEAGSTLDFQGGYTSATIVVEYNRDINL